MSRRFVLSRRAVLRGSLGVGVASVGLPLLEAMLNSNGDALAGGAPLPKHFITYFIGNGFRLDRFEPTSTGPTYSLSEELAPFVDVQEYVKVVTGLQNWCAYHVTHHEGMTAYNGYTMVELNGLYSKAGGPTLDQLIADHINATASPPPLIRSVQIGISSKTSIMDSGTTMHVLSHRGPNEPLYPQFAPQQVWQTLFSELQDKPDDSELRLAIVDSVREDAKKLRTKLGAVDRQRIDAHLDGLDQLEQKINTLPPVCASPDMPTLQNNPSQDDPEQLEAVNDVMTDLLLAALRCDVTRVASVLFIGGAAETVYNEIGQSNAHHSNTHNGGAQDEVHDGVVFAMSRVADLANKMRADVDVSGKNLLDSGCIMVGSDCSEGLTHSVSRQPYVLIGNAGDTLTGKYHHQAVARSGSEGAWTATGNTSDVLFTVLKAFNPAATSIGDMTPRPLQNNTWFGTSNPPGQAATGSSTVIDALTGPAFGT